MHQEGALLAAAHGLAQRSRPASAMSNGTLCSRRPQSACSQPAVAAEVSSAGTPAASVDRLVQEHLNPTKAASSSATSVQAVGMEQTQVAANREADTFVVQGHAARMRASEQEQYPHFFAWINMQKFKQLQAVRKQQLQDPQLGGAGSRRSVSACSQQRPGSAAKQPAGAQASSWQPSTSFKGRTQATDAGWGQHEQSRPPYANSPKQVRQAHTRRPASAVAQQAHLQRCHQQRGCSRPWSAMGWICPEAPAERGERPPNSDSSPASTVVPQWLLEHAIQAPEAPARPVSPPTHALHQPQHLDSSGTHWPTSAVRDSIASDKGLHSSISSSRPLSPAFSTVESNHQQQPQGCNPTQHAAQHLFQRLPLPDGAAMDRHALQLLMLGLQCELARLGPPVTLQAPDVTDDGHLTAEDWSAHDQVAPELQVWDKLTNELCRQTRLECSQRGVLLLTAVTRQRQLLHSSLSACDSMCSKLQGVAGASQQLHHTISNLRTELQQAQQQRAQLEATLEAEKQKLVVALQELQQQQDKMRKGRFHLIAEEVEIAKQAIEKRWMEQLTEQLQQVRGQCAAEQAVGMQQWQDKVLQIIGCAAGSDVADIIRAQLLASSASE